MPDDERDGDVVDWTVLKSIQQANAASMAAMEEYLLAAACPGADGDDERTRELLERSIERHERIVEQLELAKAGADGELPLRVSAAPDDGR